MVFCVQSLNVVSTCGEGLSILNHACLVSLRLADFGSFVDGDIASAMVFLSPARRTLVRYHCSCSALGPTYLPLKLHFYLKPLRFLSPYTNRLTYVEPGRKCLDSTKNSWVLFKMLRVDR